MHGILSDFTLTSNEECWETRKRDSCAGEIEPFFYNGEESEVCASNGFTYKTAAQVKCLKQSNTGCILFPILFSYILEIIITIYTFIEKKQDVY